MMKNKMSFLYLSVLTVLGMGHLNLANADQVQMPEHVFAPVGFDNNDNAEVVLHGYFPNSCYQAGPAQAVVTGNKITIRNTSIYSNDGVCIQALIPWTTEVNLGELAPGSYSVDLLDDTGAKKYFTDLKVTASRSASIDDFQYAYVKGAIVDWVNNEPELLISGELSLTCLRLQETRIVSSGDVIVVLPIIKRVEGIPCASPFLPIQFKSRVQLKPKKGQSTLVHIRSVNGRAVNQVIQY